MKRVIDEKWARECHYLLFDDNDILFTYVCYDKKYYEIEKLSDIFGELDRKNGIALDNLKNLSRISKSNNLDKLEKVVSFQKKDIFNANRIYIVKYDLLNKKNFKNDEDLKMDQETTELMNQDLTNCYALTLNVYYLFNVIQKKYLVVRKNADYQTLFDIAKEMENRESC